MSRLVFFILYLSLSLPVNAKAISQSVSVSPRIYTGLKKAEALISKKSYQQAEQKLKALLVDIDQNSYSQATVLRSLSSVYALKGKYSQAAKTLSSCLDLNVLPDDQRQRATLNLGQLYMTTKQYAQAISTVEPYLANNTKLDSTINVLIANAYAQLKHYRKALTYIKKAISASKNPQASWYQLNLVIYFELKQYSSAAKLLTTLIQMYPDNKKYWVQLSSVYQQLEQYKKAVVVKQLSYKKGFIDTERELLSLANLLLYINSPYKAAQLIHTEITQKNIHNNAKNWETLANAWILAKEFDKAIKTLETASKLNQKGDIDQKLGQIYVQQEKWNLAIKTLIKALNKGGLKNIGDAYLLLGMSYYELKQIKAAEKAFLSATKYRKNNKAALQWLNYIKSYS
jgi:tetratricopeptide (TPR) repeat protein